jgi:hypothetical protein
VGVRKRRLPAVVTPPSLNPRRTKKPNVHVRSPSGPNQPAIVTPDSDTPKVPSIEEMKGCLKEIPGVDEWRQKVVEENEGRLYGDLTFNEKDVDNGIIYVTWLQFCNDLIRIENSFSNKLVLHILIATNWTLSEYNFINRTTKPPNTPQ